MTYGVVNWRGSIVNYVCDPSSGVGTLSGFTFPRPHLTPRLMPTLAILYWPPESFVLPGEPIHLAMEAESEMSTKV